MRSPRQARLLALSCALLLAGCPSATITSRPSLGRAPVPPPALNDAALRAHFPTGALRSSTSGFASIRITLSAEGTVTSVDLVDESPPGAGFGEACVAVTTAHATGWQPALDQNGRPGIYRFRFRCTFEARR